MCWTYSVLFLFFVLENDVLIVFWKYYEKIQRKNLQRITISKKYYEKIQRKNLQRITISKKYYEKIQRKNLQWITIAKRIV